MGATWLSEVFGQFNRATKRFSGNGCT